MSQSEDSMATTEEMLRLTAWERRVGIREREEVVRRLMRHQGMGRLTADEYLDRVASARRARVSSDLHPLLADLEPPEDS